MAQKKWVVGQPDRETAKLLADECEIDPFAALIACGRGISDAAELELMLCEEPLLCDPKELADIEKAAEIIRKSVENGEKIAVFGDYDCDGVVSSVVVYDYLSSLGADVTVYIPDRVNEGYGMNVSAIDKLKAEGIQLIITVDNGISCFEEIAYANALGIKTVVTDHHIPPEALPEAQAVVDPHRPDCPSLFKEVCGAVVAFKLVCVLADKEPEQLLERYSDLLAVATLADVMPLVNENRSIVKQGISKIQKLPSTGIAAIITSAGIERKAVNAAKASFVIAPRINAAGRMGSAMRAFNLLISKNMLEALKIANEIDEENVRRQSIEKEICAEAFGIIEKENYKYDRVIVVASSGWHVGVLGISASRICEKYSKPAIVLSLENGMAHGSGRSFDGFNLYNAVSACGDLTEKYGGHELAAGVSIREENIDTFRRRINEYARCGEYIVPKLKLDFRINPLGMSVDMVFAMKILEPFGHGNTAPIFGIFGVKLERISPIGSGKHLRLTFSKNTGSFNALLFGVTQESFAFCTGDILDLAVVLDTSFYKEQYNLSVQIKDMRISGLDEDAYFTGKAAIDDYFSSGKLENGGILPSREQVGAVYRYICRAPVSEEKLKQVMLESIGFARTKIAVMTLCELGLIVDNGGFITVAQSKGKTELENSATYKRLKEGN